MSVHVRSGTRTDIYVLFFVVYLGRKRRMIDILLKSLEDSHCWGAESLDWLRFFLFVDTRMYQVGIASLGFVHFVGPAMWREKANSFRRIRVNKSFTMTNHELVNRFERV
jgi:hypothetical protein